MVSLCRTTITWLAIAVGVVLAGCGCNPSSAGGGKSDENLRQAFKDSAAGTTKVSAQDRAAAEQAMQSYMGKQGKVPGAPGAATNKK